ncbi:helix-turn-helix domain-containing protein [Cognatishimia maritima]|uniref:Transcriptional regulator, contains XRE-family HTH domain n=1 Tax=Cognatishimia maritima TaxID=870908 RepID=A0A1M5JL53_9RHOB|nr:helix-turn-helix transcriptional regulator [Cognatishimia maritima]SHG41000.1 Transcriptional regulator, contains XRE-family HTH domain [Cognatishimia maritima]
MNKIDVLVGKRIRARRHAMGISQSELGDAIGVKFQQIQKYETGANRVSASRLWAVAEKLGVDVVYFFEGIKRSDGTDDVAADPIDNMEFLSDRDAIEMMELYRKLPNSQRSAVLAFMRSMVMESHHNLSVANS